MHRWYICGLREVRKAVRAGKARSVVLAPNIEPCEAEGGLDDTISAILGACTEAGVPVVFALSRKRLGEIYGFRKRMSAVAVLEIGGVEGIHASALHLAEEGRARWQAAQGAADAAAAAAAAPAGGPG
jgi:selenocysteine insertion sequence-binding protein 2